MKNFWKYLVRIEFRSCTFPKPIALSTQILLDRERCVLCQRCTRFSEEIAGDAFIALQDRGAHQQIGRYDEDVLGFAGASPVCRKWFCGTLASLATGSRPRFPFGGIEIRPSMSASARI